MTVVINEGVEATKEHNKSIFSLSETQYLKDVVNSTPGSLNREMLGEKFSSLARRYGRSLERNLKMLRMDILRFLRRFSSHARVNVSFLFNLFYGVYNLYLNTSRFNFVANLVYIITLFLGDKFEKYFDVINVWCQNVLESFLKEGKLEAESFFSEHTFSLKQYFEIFLSSRVVSSVRVLILNLVGLRFFKRDHAQKFVKLLGPAVKVSLIDFTYNMLDAVEKMVDFCKDLYVTGSVYEALKKRDKELTFVESSKELIFKSSSVYLGDDMNFKDDEALVGKIPANKYIDDLRSKIFEGESIVRTIRSSAPVKTQLYALKTLLSDLLGKVRSKSRRAPIGIIIYGDPMIGKSSILTHFYKLFCKHRNYVYSHDLVYDRNPKSSFWDGHDPLVQPIIHYPEVGSIAKDIAKSKGDEAVDEMLMVSDSQPYSAEMSHVDEKGKCMIHPEMVIIDCNDPQMNLEVTNNNPAAIRRRFIYVKAEVKKEYRQSGSAALDPAKAQNSEKKMDLWNFQIYKQKPVTIKKSSVEYFVNENGSNNFDIFSLSRRFMKVFQEHDDEQVAFSHAIDESIEEYIAESSFKKSLIKWWWYPSSVWIFWITTGWLFWIYAFIFSCAEMLSFVSFIRSELNVTTLVALYITNFSPVSYLLDKVYFSLWKLKLQSKDKIQFGFRYIKSYFIQDDNIEEEITLRKRQIYPTYVLGLLNFVIIIGIIKLIFSFIRTAKGFMYQAESELIESSGNYTPNNIDSEIEQIERDTQCGFPLPKKKDDNDKNYDHVDYIVPRYAVEHRLLNDPDEIKNTIYRNIRYLKIYFSNGQDIKTHGLGICGDFIIINKHVFQMGKAISLYCSINDLANSQTRMDIDYDYIYELSGDVICMRIHGQMFKDITSYLCNFKPTTLSFKGIYRDRRITIEQLQGAIKIDAHKGTPFILDKPFKYVCTTHKIGYCGQPLLAILQNQTFLIGIHAAGAVATEFCFATELNKDEIMNIIDRNSNICKIVSEGCIRLKKGSKLEDISPKSPLLYEQTTGLRILGHMTNFNIVKPTSKLTKTAIFNEIQYLINETPLLENGKPKYLPPLMKSARLDGVYISPYNNFIRKVGVQKKDLDRKIMEETIRVVSNYLISKLSEVGITELKPFNLQIAQNGYPENFYIRSMKGSTSGGLLLPGKKDNFSKKVELDFKKDGKEPDFIVKEQVMEIIDSYLHDECSFTLVGAQLKDEPRSYSKVQIGKTRVFAMSSYDMTLVNRMYLMPFYSLMCEHRDIFFYKSWH